MAQREEQRRCNAAVVRNIVTSLRERIGIAFGLERSSHIRELRSGPKREAVNEPPLQAELYSVSQLEQHARALATGHEVRRSDIRTPDRLLPRLAANELALRAAHALVSEALRRGTRVTPAAEWFIDNYHLIEEQIRIARRHLPRGYSRELPRLQNAFVQGTPRVYDITLEFISHSHGRLDVEGLRAFVTAYQTEQPLRLGELWAIPIMLRLALLENLRRVVAAVTAGRQDRERASYWIEKMLEVAAENPAQVVLVLADMVREDPPLTLAFVAELASRLQGQGAALTFPMSWLEHRMAERGQTIDGVFQLVSQDQAANQVAIGNSIGSLRLLGATDWRDFVEAVSVVEQMLRTDPGGVYPAMDFATRNRYRLAAEEISRHSSLSETDVARAALDLAKYMHSQGGEPRKTHLGYFLVGDGRDFLERTVHMRWSARLLLNRLARRFRVLGYAGSIALLTVLGCLLLAWQASHAGLGRWTLAALLPAFTVCASQVAIGMVQWVVTLLARPRILPRLDFSAGIPLEHRTVVAVPILLTDAGEIERLLGSLEVRFLANRDEHLAVALLSDFRDAASAQTEEDAALLEAVRAGIQALNASYPGSAGGAPFFLFHRERAWNPSERVWMGRERKRGKLEDFNAALRGELERFDTIVGDAASLANVKYVIALDGDTDLPRDAAKELAATLAHPLNRPVYDEKLGRVSAGYGILQPRVAISMASSGASRFARLFAGEPGVDLYTRAVSDVYQDVFGEGSFVGKGIYDLDMFRQALGSRLPSNRILSHDLLEGAYARSGLVSDILLFEDYPATYAADVIRRYRWTRGDWQITPWLSNRVPNGSGVRTDNSISGLSRWKVLDNLRRGLFPIALLTLLGTGWWAPGTAGPATLAVVAILVLPGLLSAAAELARRSSEVSLGPHLSEVGHTLGRQLLREAFALACLPYDALLSTTAIARTAVRVLFTGRGLLEWRTARDAQQSQRANLAESYLVMWVAPLAAAVAALALSLHARAALGAAAPVIGLWLLAPAVAWWLSQPSQPLRPQLDPNDSRFLRGVARRTWRFFETFVGREDHYLPPDNFQEDPPVGLAHRTSPTNIGLSLTASLAAYDFGYLSAAELLERTSRTLVSMNRLQRYRGHLYNWYDTRSLEPLPPLYVSTVDSGNLVGHLITLSAGLVELAGHETFRTQLFLGLGDTLDVMAQISAAPASVLTQVTRVRSLIGPLPTTVSGSCLLLEQLSAGGSALEGCIGTPATPELVGWVSAFRRQCQRASEELSWLAPWLTLLPSLDLGEHPELPALRALLLELDRLPTLAATARLSETVLRSLDGALQQAQNPWLTQLRASLVLAEQRAQARLDSIRELATQSLELSHPEFEFLYDPQRHLLSIGYNATDQRLDASYYDLLASEARLASFVAVAQGQLPQEHWFSLGRLLTTTSGKVSLVSWSGSMFEYLMPLLIMPTYDRTILDDTYRGVVLRQIEYGRKRGVPWGVSESGYNKTDAALNYQYHAFGVPGLGFRRGLADDLVVTPHASALALMVDPERACANLQRLAREGVLDDYGFYEAVDYTPARLPHGKDREIVRSYMAHHQGMTFLALAYLLCDRPMQRRFDAHPAFRATDLLLQERVPRVHSVYPHQAEVSGAGGGLIDAQSSVRVFTTADTPAPEVHLLSNGSYHVAITNSGGGYSRWRDLAVTRWHEDPTRDPWGSFCYVRDVTSGAFWSVAHQPSLVLGQSYEAIFSLGRAEFRRRDGDLETHVEISISPEDDVELRRVSITNRGRSARTLELTSFAEVVLAPRGADAAHPAFSNLFVQTELVRTHQGILCTRRPRSGEERPPWLLHLMTVQGRQVGPTSYETGRAEFIGRGRSAADPLAMHRESLTNSEGAVLDPVVAIRNRVVIQPDRTLRLHLATGVSETREAALALLEKYSDHHSAERVFDLSWTHSQVVLRQLDLTEADTQLYERLASHLIYANPTLRAPRGIIARNKSGQSALWAYGISGDLPIVLVRISDREQLDLVRQLAKAHTYWRLKGLVADLVIWNEDSSGYRHVLHDDILGVIGPSAAGLLDRPGGIFVRRGDQLSEEDKVLMQTVARLILSDTDGPLSEQVNRRLHVEMPAWLFASAERAPPAAIAVAKLAPQPARPDLVAFNGLGGFTNDGREYVITTTREARTPAPWVNVLANPWFGSVVSESGGAYTWCENAHTYRLTPWHNDPVTDDSGEALYIRDEADGRFWSPTPLPCGGESPYSTRHGFGYSVFEHSESGVSSQLHTYVATDAPIKFVVLKLKNQSGRPRRFSLTAFFELVLGEHRSANAPHVVSEVEPKSGALFARNAYNGEFSARIAFLDSSEAVRSVSGDRLELLGRNGNTAQPAFLRRAQLSGRVGASLDPCLAMQVPIELMQGQERDVVFIFGSGRDLADARSLVQRFRGTGPARAALEAVWTYWNRTLGAVNVQTPDASLNFLANGWLLYQVIASRLWGRSGFYQSGGAFGFRDQLQDAMALVHAEPGLLREQIVRAAARQFREGDVQHWWHPPLGRGVRTRISDDYLWLPYALCRYVLARGDVGVLTEKIHFLEGRSVNLEEDSYYDLPHRSEETATVYEHCRRAIEHGLRFGARGLPLMGGGDWNDGMNLVGERGQGESVWLAFFLYDVLLRFVDIARMAGDEAFAQRCSSRAAELRQNIEQHAWDGEWYRRAYFDDGQPLGSQQNSECQIDSLPQSWATLSGAGDAERSRQALGAVDARLVRRDLALIQLFSPPFDSSELKPGYVKGYLPGVRENGGQYSHAAVWVVMAFAAAGNAERAWELFGLINPVRHGDSSAAIATYKVEPYVVAADVYTNPQHAGRGGWTWYTGSAAWMYRLVLESLLGVRLEHQRLRIEPLLPRSWPGFDLHYRHGQALYHIQIKNLGGETGARNVTRVSCDGIEQTETTILLHDDASEHRVEIELGGPSH
jgi:cyclic beta-1,2-glucan synthetase